MHSVTLWYILPVVPFLSSEVVWLPNLITFLLVLFGIRAMGRLMLFVVLLLIGGGIFFKYFASDVITPRYESNTAKLIGNIDNLSATAARRN